MIQINRDIRNLRQRLLDNRRLREGAGYLGGGYYYQDFRQISDEEVIEMLDRFLPKPKEREPQPPAA